MTEERFESLKNKFIETTYKNNGYNKEFIEKYLKVIWDGKIPKFYIDLLEEEEEIDFDYLGNFN